MRYFSILLAAVVLAGAGFVAPENEASARYTAADRASIRAMPIEQRPNRPGHFYGNTVRRLNRR